MSYCKIARVRTSVTERFVRSFNYGVLEVFIAPRYALYRDARDRRGIASGERSMHCKGYPYRKARDCSNNYHYLVPLFHRLLGHGAPFRGQVFYNRSNAGPS